jgi:phosphopantothenoylcysteine decarboxylase/phosphopantothenate--cysteine ligase
VLTEEKAFTDLFDLKDEAEIGHIRLSREADLVVVAPATAGPSRQDGAWLS